MHVVDLYAIVLFMFLSYIGCYGHNIERGKGGGWDEASGSETGKVV